MSFIRPGKPNMIRRKRTGVKKKPAWDDTLQDLSVHRASVEDQLYRKNMHVSKNSLSARLQKIERSQRKVKSPKQTAKQMAVMKEILYDKQQLHDVLSKSDQMMAVVQDLFGDDPRRFAGFPNVTSAPNETKQNGSLDASELDIRTQLEALSDSVMNTIALNSSSDEEDSNDDGPEAIVYQPRLNLDRFHQFLAAEEQNASLSTISGAGFVTSADELGGKQNIDKMGKGSADGSIFETPPGKKSGSRSQTPKSAANDTAKIKRSKKHTLKSEEVMKPNPALSMDDLKQLLMSLQSEITELERQTGRSVESDLGHGDTFSGYTMALVTSVTRLTRHLRETDIRLRAEMTVRELLTQDVAQLATMLDALTSDIISTQEDFSQVLTEFGKHKLETKTELEQIKAILINAGLCTEKIQPQNKPAITNTTHMPVQQQQNIPTSQSQQSQIYLQQQREQHVNGQKIPSHQVQQQDNTCNSAHLQHQQQQNQIATMEGQTISLLTRKLQQENAVQLKYLQEEQIPNKDGQRIFSHQKNPQEENIAKSENLNQRTLEQGQNHTNFNTQQYQRTENRLARQRPESDQGLTGVGLSSTDQPETDGFIITPPKNDRKTEHQEMLTDGIGLRKATASHSLLDMFPAAILLSPPVQRTRLPEEGRNIGRNLSLEKEFYGPQPSDSQPVLAQKAVSHPTAVVNVPRPVRLVQTNVPVNFNQHPPTKLGQKDNYMSDDHHQPIRTVPESLDQHEPIRTVPLSLDQHQQMRKNPESLYQHQPIRMVPRSHGQHQPIGVVPESHGYPNIPNDSQSSSTIPESVSQTSSAFRVVGNVTDPTNNVTTAKADPKEDNPILATQIAELNRQHEEAQRRLQTMLLQQQQHQQKMSSLHKGAQLHTRPSIIPGAGLKQTNNLAEQVSPEVSPISERSSSVRGRLPQDQNTQQDTMRVLFGHEPQRITVSMPRVDMDLSQFSDISPSPHAEPCQ